MSDRDTDEDLLEATEAILNAVATKVRVAAQTPQRHADLVEGFTRGFGMERILLSGGPGALSRDVATLMLAEHGATLRDDGQEAAFLGYTVASIRLELFDYPPDHPQAERVEALRHQIADIVALIGPEVEDARVEVIKGAVRH